MKNTGLTPPMLACVKLKQKLRTELALIGNNLPTRDKNMNNIATVEATGAHLQTVIWFVVFEDLVG